MQWLLEYGYIVWALFSACVLAGLVIYWRKNPDARGAKSFFYFVPRLDPTGRTPPQVTRRAWWLFGFGIVLLGVLSILDALGWLPR
jgi:hypothetical protein